MKASLTLLMVVGLLVGSVTAAKTVHTGGIHDYLEFFEDFFIRNIWLNISYYGGYMFFPTIICGLNLQDTVIEELVSAGGTYLAGIVVADAKTKMAETADDRCNKAFELLYDVLNYSMNTPTWDDGDFDQFSYTVA